MRVLHLVKTSVGARWAALQMGELVKLGVDVHVTLPPGDKLVAFYRDLGVTVHRKQFDFPAGRPRRIPRLLKDFRAFVNEIRPDIIHSHFVGTTLTMRMALGRKHPIPRVFHVHGILHLEHRFFRWLDIALAGSRDYWIGASRWVSLRYLRSGIPSNRVFLSYDGIDLDRFESVDRLDLRRMLNLSNETIIVGMVAYMYKPRWYLGYRRGIKGHEYLIDALTICMKKNPSIIGVFVGGAWEDAHRYERRVRRYGKKRCGDRVIFMGTREDVLQIIPNFNVVVVPSLSENLGGAQESLLLEVPVISTYVGGMPDLISHGETGLLVPPRNPKRLAQAILQMLGDPAWAKETAKRGRKSTLELLDVKKTGRQMLGIYQKVLSERKPTH